MKRSEVNTMTETEWLACNDVEKMLIFLRDYVTVRKLRLFGCACCRRISSLIVDRRSRDAVEIAEQYADGKTGRKELAISRMMAEQARLEAIEFRIHRSDDPYPWAEESAVDLSKESAASVSVILTATDVLWTQQPWIRDQNEEIEEQLAVGLSSNALMSVAKLISPGVPLASIAAFTVSLLASQATAWRAEPAPPKLGLSEPEPVYSVLLRHILGNPFRSFPTPSFGISTITSLAEALYAGQDCHYALADALMEAGHVELAEHFREPDHPKGCWALDVILGNQ
jgi:hypothetical protein